MIYFITWVVFLLIAILAVPIASMMDKKNRSFDTGEYDDGEFAEDDPYAEASEVPMEAEAADDGFGGNDGGFGDGGFAEAGVPDDGGFPAPSDDDFAAFE